MTTARDWVAAGITLQKGLVGAKPEAFCWWLFEVLGLESHDTLTDLFPGTGVVGRTWERYRRQRQLFEVQVERAPRHAITGTR